MTAKSVLYYLKLVPSETRRSYRTEYNWYPDVRSWAVRIYDRVLRKAPRVLLPGRKVMLKMRFEGMTDPFYFRLGSSDLQLHQTIRFRGEYGPVMAESFPSDLRQIIDLGSNAGYTLRLWREMYPHARIIGVEPDPGNLHVCRLNAESIPGGRVDLVQACVDGKSGTVWLDRSYTEHQFRIGDGPSPHSIEVPALTVPQILEQTQADEEIGILKCDVQGAEKAVFADCRSWIGRVRNMIVEVHPPYEPEHLLADLTRNGWQWRKHVIHRTDQLDVLFFWDGGPRRDAMGTRETSSVASPA